MQITEVNPKVLKPYKKNNKKHPPEQIEKIKASITNFGFNTPIILDKEGNIIAGHGRVTAAVELGLETIPAVYKHDLSPENIRAYRIADNRTAISDWDFDNLKVEFEELKNADFDISLTGFDDVEIDEIMGESHIPEMDGKDPYADFKSYRIVRVKEHKVICHNKPDCEFCEKLKIEYGDRG